MHFSLIALTVHEYDEAIHFYTNALGFQLIEDTDLSATQPGKRWVRVRPPRNSSGPDLLLARATNPTQRASVGNQTGGRVFLFLQTDDIARDHRSMLAAGVKFTQPPTQQPHGTVAVFEDLYGNRFDLIQPKLHPPQ